MDANEAVKKSVFLAGKVFASEAGAMPAALHLPEPQAAVIESVQAFMLRVQPLDLTRCTKCATGVMQVTAAIAPKRLWLQPTTEPPP